MLTDTELYNKIVALPEAVKGEVVQYLEEKLNASAKETSERKPRRGGWAKGMIVMHDDFDEPLEGFKEYMQVADFSWAGRR